MISIDLQEEYLQLNSMRMSGNNEEFNLLKFREFVFHNWNIFLDKIVVDFLRFESWMYSPRKQSKKFHPSSLSRLHTSSGKAVRNSSKVNICSLDVFNLFKRWLSIEKILVKNFILIYNFFDRIFPANILQS